jgi:hypothetical protein
VPTWTNEGGSQPGGPNRGPRLLACVLIGVALFGILKALSAAFGWGL